MGRRSRRRDVVAAAPVQSRTRARGPNRTFRSRRSEAPPAPWAPLPLVELAILIGLGLLVAGFVMRGSSRGHVMLGAGVALVGVASLEQAFREHFAGYRSHSTLLAGAAAVATLAAIAFLASSLPRYVALIAAVLVFAFLFRLLRAGFKRRSGVSFRA